MRDYDDHYPSNDPSHHPTLMSRVPVVIMAGGYGTRLEPLTTDMPKPLVKVAGKPVIDYTLEHLENSGFRQATVTLHYLPEQIPEHLEHDWSHIPELNFSYSPLDLGTAGAVRLAAQQSIGSPMLIHSGDVISDTDFSALIEFHCKTESVLTMALARVADPNDFGLVEIDESGRVREFNEKPDICSLKDQLVNAGIYVINRETLRRIPANKHHDFAQDLIPELISQELRVSGVEIKGAWFDIGTHERLEEATRYYEQRPRFLKSTAQPTAFSGLAL